MKYVSLDLETTCIEDKRPENILMISMVVEDPRNLVPTDMLPHFTCFVKASTLSGEPYALAMNGWILDIISGRKVNTTNYPILSKEEWIKEADAFLVHHFGESKGKIPLAGKNVGTFDLGFLPESLKKRFSYKIIDPAMKFTDLLNDDKVANLETCKVKAGLPPVVVHDAREDAIDVINVLRTTYGKN